MKTKIISFYSDLHDSYYSTKAKELKNKCQQFNIPHDIVGLPSQGSYMLNCLMKPNFIKTMMEKYKCPLIWMDCDTNLVEPFTIFDDNSCDIGFATHTGTLEGIKASPLYFNYNKNFEIIIDTWIESCKKGLQNNGVELDHDALKHDTLPKIKDKISIFFISENYNDYCNGKYIKNGNSRVLGKSEIHTKLQNINRGRRL
jgi:hypothetical protein